MIAPAAVRPIQRKVFLKIGRPGYRVTKVRDSATGKEGLMVQIHLPHVKAGVLPRRRFMSAWEQRKETPNKAYQYLIVSVSYRLSFCAVSDLCVYDARSPLSRTKQSLSIFQLVKLKTSRMKQGTGIGRTGIRILSSIVSNLCSARLTDCINIVRMAIRDLEFVYLAFIIDEAATIHDVSVQVQKTASFGPVIEAASFWKIGQ
jgi:hypothetical protein